MRTCARPDCSGEARDRGYCIRCSALVRRWAVPYRRAEQMEELAGNSYAREMTEALEADPPVIVWRHRKGVQVAVHVHDPHTTVPKRHDELTYIGEHWNG